MGDKSKIEWTDASWNPTRGCSLVSAGCTNCYAMRVAAGVAKEHYAGLTRESGGRPVWTGEVRLVPELLEQPLRWKRPRRIFVDSMSDLFHPDVPFGYIDHVFAVMALCPQHTFQVLTKRPEQMPAYFAPIGGTQRSDWVWSKMASILNRQRLAYPTWPLPNVWLGTSVEDQAAADERIPHLLRTPAAVRFLSCEPLIGPVTLRKNWSDWLEGWDTEAEHVCGGDEQRCYRLCPEAVQVETERIDWVIVGGESGPGARPCNLGWIRDIVRQCSEASVPCFVKQLGAWPWIGNPDDVIGRRVKQYGADGTDRICLGLQDRKGGDWDEWPEDLRVREYPA